MPTVRDIEPLAAALDAVTLGPPLHHRALTVFPLLATGWPETGWLTLGEAGDAVSIAEVSEQGSVPSLTVTNAGDRPLLLLDGEELVGAKQNRVLNTTVLVGAGATLVIPVSCVEQGRWSYRGKRFAKSDVSLIASLRRAKAARVSASLRRGAGHDGGQAEVWDDLAAFADERGVTSPTGAMHDVYVHHAGEIGAAREALAAQPGQVGAIVHVSGQWAGLDLLATPGLFASLWPGVYAGYAADAFGERPRKRLLPSPTTCMESVIRSEVEPAAAVGLGVEYRLTGRTAGAALEVDAVVAHLMAFPPPPADRASRKGRRGSRIC
jgi:hypothetical protein